MADLAPVMVLDVEVGQPLPEISPWRRLGPRYRTAQVVVRDGGVPIGRRQIALGETALGPQALAEGLAGLWHPGPARPAPAIPAAAPFISVVVPSAMSRPQELRRCVRRLAELAYPAFEVIVVDNRPNRTQQRAAVHAELATHPLVRVVTQPVPGSSAARNRGIAAARGDIVAFVDDDVDVEPGWLTAIAHRFAADPRVDCVTGWVFPAVLDTPAQVWFESSGATIGVDFEVVSYQRGGGPKYTVNGNVPIYRGIFGGSGNLAVRSRVLAKRGGFHESLGVGTASRGGEDVEFLARLLHHGHRVTMDPAVAVRHHHRTAYPELRRQMFGYGVGYTAALTALVAADPRHLLGLARMVRAAATIFKRRRGRAPVHYPAGLRWAERWGLLCGPVAFLRSRLGGMP